MRLYPIRANFRPATVQKLRRLAEDVNAVNMTDAVVLAIDLGLMTTKVLAEGGRVIFEQPCGCQTELHIKGLSDR